MRMNGYNEKQVSIGDRVKLNEQFFIDEPRAKDENCVYAVDRPSFFGMYRIIGNNDIRKVIEVNGCFVKFMIYSQEFWYPRVYCEIVEYSNEVV